jgi:hypothetical protein
MPKRKRKVSARLQAARDAHDKFLRKHGIGSPKPLKGHDIPSYKVEGNAKLTNEVPGSGTPVGTGRHSNHGLVIGQPYHKGPLMVIQSKDDLKSNKRRQ